MHCHALEPDLPNLKSQAQYSLPGCILTSKPQSTDIITRTKPSLLYRLKLTEGHVTGQPQNCEVCTHRTFQSKKEGISLHKIYACPGCSFLVNLGELKNLPEFLPCFCMYRLTGTRGVHVSESFMHLFLHTLNSILGCCEIKRTIKFKTGLLRMMDIYETEKIFLYIYIDAL